jgi:hypothetical protein
MKIKDIILSAKNALWAILKGELLLRLQVDKLFIHIAYLFLIVFIGIYLNMKIDNTLTRLEKNKRILNDLEIYHAEKTDELVKLGRFSTVQQNLRQMGSALDTPSEPATTLKKR